MTDLAALAAELLPGAEWVAGERPGRQIAWVRVLRARVPAFDALEAGDLVIAPAPALAVVAPAPAELANLVAALAAAPVSGVVLVDTDAAVGEALRGAAVPAIRVERTDPLDLERSVVGFIVAGGAELERQAALLEAELRRRALEGGGVAGLVGAVSAFLGRALALEAGRDAGRAAGRAGRRPALVVHAPAEVPRAAADAARYESKHTEVAEALRVPLPSAKGPGGSLIVLGSEPVSALARVALPRVAGLLALELAREADVRGAADRGRQVEPMPSAGPPWTVLLARQRDPGAEDDTDAARAGREEVRRALRLVAPARRMALRGDADSVDLRLVVGGTTEDVLRLADDIAARVGRLVAISRPFTVATDRPGAEAEARSTLEAALALETPPRLARADRLAFYRMLGALHRLPEGPRLARAVLEPLLDARPDIRRERLETLRALLAHGGVGEAAAALGVHRNTVAYRLRRIEAATGWRLADPELRLPLAMALGLVQDDQV